MDALRSCYKSMRRVYSDRPDVLLSGRYYFLPDDTPYLPIAHCFGSANWMRGQISESPLIGEQLEPRTWYDGRPPPVMPLRRVCGSIDKFATGEPYGLTPGEPSGVWGLPKCCMPGFAPLRIQFLGDVSVGERRMLCALAALGVEVRHDDHTAALEIIHSLFGASVDTHFQPLDLPGKVPHMILCWNANMALAWIGGSEARAQISAQLIDSNNGPTRDTMGISTTETYDDWSANARTVIDSVLPDTELPILICGHSLGGAVAQMLAVRFNNRNPARGIKIITWGQPKGGDSRFAARLDALDSMRIVHERDPICAFPPDLSAIGFYGLNVPLFSVVLPGWRVFRHSRRQLLLANDGSLTPFTGNSAFLQNFPGWLAAVALGNLVPFEDNHAMVRYAELVCSLVDPEPEEHPVSSESISNAEEILDPGFPLPPGSEVLFFISDEPENPPSYPGQRTDVSEWTAYFPASVSENYDFVASLPEGAVSGEEATLLVRLCENGEEITVGALAGSTLVPLALFFGTFTMPTGSTLPPQGCSVTAPSV